MQPFHINQATPRTALFITELNASWANFILEYKRHNPPQEVLNCLDIKIQILRTDNHLLSPFVFLSSSDTMPSDAEKMILHKYAPTKVIINSSQAHALASKVLPFIQKQQADLESKKTRLLQKKNSFVVSATASAAPSSSSTISATELMPPSSSPQKTPLPQNQLPSLSTSSSTSFPSPPPPPSPQKTSPHHSPVSPCTVPNLGSDILSPTPFHQLFSFPSTSTSPSTTTLPLPRTPPLAKTPPPSTHSPLYSISPVRPSSAPPSLATSFSPTPPHSSCSPMLSSSSERHSYDRPSCPVYPLPALSSTTSLDAASPFSPPLRLTKPPARPIPLPQPAHLSESLVQDPMLSSISTTLSSLKSPPSNE